MRKVFVIVSSVTLAILLACSFRWRQTLWAFVFVGPVVALGIADMTQKRRALRRNFPILGHGRYLLELIRPEISQYFIESNTDGMPFNREQRSVVYQRAKGELDTLPFGTQRNLYE